MKINDLMRLVAENYDDHGTDAFWDYKNEKVDCEGTGDTLAEFIVREIHDTFEPDLADRDQLLEAGTAIGRGAEQLHNLSEALWSEGLKLKMDMTEALDFETRLG
jgi:hypothetical protein